MILLPPRKLTSLRMLFLLLALTASVGAPAAVYNFRIVTGGQKVPQITGAGAYILVEVVPDPGSAGRVLFRFTSRIPQPVSGLSQIAFDTGAYAGLFSSMSVTQKIGADMAPRAPATHPYWGDLKPDFAFMPAGGAKVYDPRMLNPGEYLTIAAALKPGMTFRHVIAALNQGMSRDPAVASAGLRIGVIAFHLLGTRPDPRKTIMDDGGFVTASLIAQ